MDTRHFKKSGRVDYFVSVENNLPSSVRGIFLSSHVTSSKPTISYKFSDNGTITRRFRSYVQVSSHGNQLLCL